ncbi:MAG: hypothetical protein WCA46_23655 [Actinocatenispora sp.]
MADTTRDDPRPGHTGPDVAEPTHDPVPRAGRFRTLPARIRPEDLSTTQAEPRVPLPEDPHRDALQAGG